MLAAAPQPPAPNDDDLTAAYMAGIERGRDSLEAKLREQEPVAAQRRFRHPQKTMPDWAPWQPCRVDMRQENWSIDSMGYEVEYRNLYARPVPTPDARELVEALADLLAYVEDGYGDHDSAEGSEARAALTKHRGQS